MKRQEYLSWNEYFMSIAYLSAQRSKDPVTQVGACIVNDQHKILSIGYNGFPSGISDDDLPWGKNNSYLENKYPYVCHAELNAILNNVINVSGCAIYVTLFPCNECAKLIIQSGIKKVIYANNKYPETDIVVASTKMLTLANISLEQYKFSGKTVRFDI
jgi:dCMP deaminase